MEQHTVLVGDHSSSLLEHTDRLVHLTLGGFFWVCDYNSLLLLHGEGRGEEQCKQKGEDEEAHLDRVSCDSRVDGVECDIWVKNRRMGFLALNQLVEVVWNVQGERENWKVKSGLW